MTNNGNIIPVASIVDGKLLELVPGEDGLFQETKTILEDYVPFNKHEIKSEMALNGLSIDHPDNIKRYYDGLRIQSKGLGADLIDILKTTVEYSDQFEEFGLFTSIVYMYRKIETIEMESL